MRRAFYAGALCAAIPLLAACGAVATPMSTPTPNARDPAIEQEIVGRLALINPDAVPVFVAATEAGDANRLEEARQGFLQVLRLAPDFPDALRRLSSVETYLGEEASAVVHAQAALDLQPSAWNEGALALALLSGADAADYRRAFDLARHASQEEPKDEFLAYVLMMAAARIEEVDTLRSATDNLLTLQPQNPVAHFFAGVLAAFDGRWESAERELRLSQRLGMPAEAVESALDSGIRAQAAQRRWARRGALVVIGWAAGLLALFFVGTGLSRATLAAVSHRSGEADLPVRRRERGVRTVYRAVIAVAALYFYISIPVVILLTIAAFGAVMYAFLQIGTIPVQFFAFLVIGAILTLLAIARSVLTRVREGDPGRPLSRGEAPNLWRLTEEVARRLDTPALEAIYVSPGAAIAVLERGGALARMRGKGRRSLVLGLGALVGMNQGQLKAILAHEYGHFSHRDTAGGDLALQVQASLQRLAYGLASAGQARWYNPAWVFVHLFLRIFLRITLGASRLQEILADRTAAKAYGAEAFASGLRLVVQQNILFPAVANQEIQSAGDEQRDLRNLYTLPAPVGEPGQLDRQLDEAMNRPTSPYDSHPAPRQRLELLGQARGDSSHPFDDEPVSDLIPGLEGLQLEMTSLVQQRARPKRA